MIVLDQKNIILVIFWILISIVEDYLIDWQNLTVYNLQFVSWLILINLLLQIFCWKISKSDYVSFFFAFVIFYYIFHFGQVLITGLLPDYPLEYLNYVTSYMNDVNLGKTIEVCIICINCFYIGGLLLKYKIKQSYVAPPKNVGKQLFWILFPIKLGLDILQLAVALYLGYNGVNIVMRMVPGIIACLGNMWYAVIPIYYLTLLQENKRTKARNLVIWTIGYMCITMLTGNRGHQVVAIICLLIIVYLTQNKHSVKNLIKYGVYGVVGLFFIDIVYAFRETSITEFFSNFSSFTESEDNTNIIIETIGTFGESIFTPYLVIDGMGTSFSPFFGEAFLKSIVGVIPDATGIFKNINDQAIFTRQLGTENAIGGSFAGEMYYNFKNLYPVPSLIIGAIFSIISQKVNLMVRLKHYAAVTFSIAVCGLFIWWVRDSVGNLTRQVCWMWLLIYFFGGFSKRHKRISKKTNYSLT